MLIEPSDVQVDPLLETYPVSVFPTRDTFPHAGAAPACVVADVVVVPPSDVRYWNIRPLLGVTSAKAFRLLAVNPLRIITPARASPFVFCCVATRAITSPSPVIVVYVN